MDTLEIVVVEEREKEVVIAYVIWSERWVGGVNGGDKIFGGNTFSVHTGGRVGQWTPKAFQLSQIDVRIGGLGCVWPPTSSRP